MTHSPTLKMVDEVADARQDLVDALWLEIGPGAARVVGALDAYLDARVASVQFMGALSVPQEAFNDIVRRELADRDVTIIAPLAPDTSERSPSSESLPPPWHRRARARLEVAWGRLRGRRSRS